MGRDPKTLSEYALAVLGELDHTLRRRIGLSLFVLFVAVALTGVAITVACLLLRSE